jgi:predicted outer membrane repeat protein
MAGRALVGSGGAILADHSRLLLANVIVRHNQAVGDGGGIFATNHSTITISSDFVPAGPGLQAAAPSCDPSALPADHYCSEFRENSAGLGGGGLALTDGSTANISHTALSRIRPLRVRR